MALGVAGSPIMGTRGAYMLLVLPAAWSGPATGLCVCEGGGGGDLLLLLLLLLI